MQTTTARVPHAGISKPIASALFATAALTVLLAACSDPVGSPDADLAASAHRNADVTATAVPRWNEVAQGLIVKNRPNPPTVFRQLAYLSVAQYAAIVAAERSNDRPRPSVDGAVAGASAAALSYFHAGDAAAIADSVRAGEPTAPAARARFAAGEALGRQIAAQVIARAASDNFGLPYTGPIPTGDGYWFSSATPPAPPLLPRLGEMRPFFLSSGSQLRPKEPPTFGSPEYLAALAEVRDVARSRTPEQIRIAQFWALPAGTVSPGGYWNQVAIEIIRDKHVGERRAARALALANIAMIDASIAIADAKYTWWYIRPSQADPSITMAIGLPNHPSYPSNHSAASMAAATVLAAIFPFERERLIGMAEEASISRLYGGIHYRFDLEAGKKMGAEAGRIALRESRGDGLLAVAHP